MNKNNESHNEVNDDENDSPDVVPPARTGQHVSIASAHSLNLSNILLHRDFMHLLQPSASSLQRGAGLVGLQSQMNEPMTLNPSLPSVIAARTQHINQLQHLLSLHQNRSLTPAQNSTMPSNNFSMGANSGRAMWSTSALVQAAEAWQLQYQQGNNLLASLTAANMGSPGVGTRQSASRALLGVANPPSYKKSYGPRVMYMDCDDESLSEYQCLLRKQIELFEAYVKLFFFALLKRCIALLTLFCHVRNFDDVQWNAQGRNKAIQQGQVSIPFLFVSIDKTFAFLNCAGCHFANRSESDVGTVHG